MKDFDYFDTYAMSAWTQLQATAAAFSAEDFNMGVDETFTTILSNTKQAAICPGGEDIAVTYDNYQQFIELSMKARLNEAETQLKWLKEGVTEIIDMNILDMLSWDEIEKRACGGQIEPESLKSITRYSSCNEDSKIVKWFWQMFEAWGQEDRKNYLKFAWGRSKLPFDLSKSDPHKFYMYSSMGKKAFPKAHTCYFQTDCPNYDEYEVMVDRFTYAIQTCGEIDDDGRPNDPGRDYGDEDD